MAVAGIFYSWILGLVIWFLLWGLVVGLDGGRVTWVEWMGFLKRGMRGVETLVGGRRLGAKVWLMLRGWFIFGEGSWAGFMLLSFFFWSGGKGSREKGFPVQPALVSACCGW